MQRGGEVAKAQMAELQQGRHAADAERRAGGDNARLLGQQLEGRAQEVTECICTTRACCMLHVHVACACVPACAVRAYACATGWRR